MNSNFISNKYYILICFCLLIITRWNANAQNHVPSIFSDKEHTTVIPFEYYPPNVPSIVVMVSINGEPPLPFILDTGAEIPLMLSVEGAKKLNIHLTAHDKKADKMWVVAIKSLDFPPRKVDGKDVEGIRFMAVGMNKALIIDNPAFFGSYEGKPIAGFVGISLFATAVLQFDFAAKIIYAGFKPHKPLQIPNATMLPMHRTNDNHYAVYLQTKEGKPVSFMIDTGANEIELPRKAVVGFRAQPTYKITDIVTIDGEKDERAAWLPNLTIGNYTEQSLYASYPEDKKVSGEGILGMAFLARFRLTLDFPNKQAFFERGDDYQERIRPAADYSFDIVQHDGKYFVSNIEEGYAAEKAGVMDGDRIVEADGVVLTGLSTEQVVNQVYGLAGTTAHLVLERKGERKEVSYLRYGIQTLVAYPGYGVGIGIRREGRGPVLIIHVIPASPAQETNLAIGDKITAVNGTPVEKLGFEAILTALNSSVGTEVKLDILPKGQTTIHTVTLKARKLL